MIQARIQPVPKNNSSIVGIVIFLVIAGVVVWYLMKKRPAPTPSPRPPPRPRPGPSPIPGPVPGPSPAPHPGPPTGVPAIVTANFDCVHPDCSSCWGLDQPAQYCVFNYHKSKPTVPIVAGKPTTASVGISVASLAPAVNRLPQLQTEGCYYLNPPFDVPDNHTNVEFFFFDNGNCTGANDRPEKCCRGQPCDSPQNCFCPDGQLQCAPGNTSVQVIDQDSQSCWPDESQPGKRWMSAWQCKQGSANLCGANGTCADSSCSACNCTDPWKGPKCTMQPLPSGCYKISWTDSTANNQKWYLGISWQHADRVRLDGQDPGWAWKYNKDNQSLLTNQNNQWAGLQKNVDEHCDCGMLRAFLIAGNDPNNLPEENEAFELLSDANNRGLIRLRNRCPDDPDKDNIYLNRWCNIDCETLGTCNTPAFSFTPTRMCSGQSGGAFCDNGIYVRWTHAPKSNSDIDWGNFFWNFEATAQC